MSGVQIKNVILVILSAAGGFLVKFLGGTDAALKALIAFMVVDYFTGLTVAGVFHKSKKTKNGSASSKEGFKGFIKKMFMLSLVGLAHGLDVIMKADYMRTMLIMFFIGNEGLSILENVGLMGMKYPAFLHKALEVLRESNDEGVDSNE